MLRALALAAMLVSVLLAPSPSHADRRVALFLVLVLGVVVALEFRVVVDVVVVLDGLVVIGDDLVVGDVGVIAGGHPRVLVGLGDVAGLVLGLDGQPALPQPFTFVTDGKAGAHSAGLLVGESDDGVRVGLEVQPPRGMPFVPAVHGETGDVRPVLQVGDDHVALSAGLATDRGEKHRTPATFARWCPEEPAAADPVQSTVTAPERVLEPRRRELWRSGCGVGHRVTPLALDHGLAALEPAAGRKPRAIIQTASTISWTNTGTQSRFCAEELVSMVPYIARR